MALVAPRRADGWVIIGVDEDTDKTQKKLKGVFSKWGRAPKDKWKEGV